MSEFFDALNKGWEVRKNILKSCGCNEVKRGTLEKGFNNIFGYSLRENFSVPKKGKDIKERLKIILSKEEQRAASTYAEAVSLVSKIGSEPSDSAGECYCFDGWEEAIGNVPNFYSWKQQEEAYEKKSSDSSLVVENTDQKDDTCKLIEKYNCLLRKWLDCKKSIAMLTTMVSNLEDNKSYSLTIEEAAKLGL